MPRTRHIKDRIQSTSLLLAFTGVFTVVFLSGAFANDAPKVDKAAAAWFDTLEFSGHIEGGVTFNANTPAGAPNVGHLFTDKADQPVLNQLFLTMERPFDPQSPIFNVGFKLQAMFGSDSRYTHGYAQFDHLIRNRNQLDINEATIRAHAPILTEGGVDIKIGQFPNPMSPEFIDASQNALYSHSYIFNFGIPLKQTGFLTTTHVTPLLDIYAGLDTGVNSFVTKNGYNNDFIKGQFGFGLNLMGGDVAIVGLTHIGAENPKSAGYSRDTLRYLNDINVTWKVNDKLTLINDVNYIQDDGPGAIGYGMAQYAIYQLNDHISLVGRGEVWRDNSGFFAAAFPGQFDYVNSERGLPATVYALPRTTYGAITLGANIKPDVPKSIEGFVIRPELRVDYSLNGSKPFNIKNGVGRDDISFTPAVDVIVPF